MLVNKMYLETLTLKDPKKASTFCLHHIVPILWQSPKFDATMCKLTDNKLVNNQRAAMGSGMECHIRTKAARTRDVDVVIDPNEDVLSVKESDESWMKTMNDLKKMSDHVIAALEEKTIYSKRK